MIDSLLLHQHIISNEFIEGNKGKNRDFFFLHIQNGLNGKFQKGSGLAKTMHVYIHNQHYFYIILQSLYNLTLSYHGTLEVQDLDYLSNRRCQAHARKGLAIHILSSHSFFVLYPRQLVPPTFMPRERNQGYGLQSHEGAENAQRALDTKVSQDPASPT